MNVLITLGIIVAVFFWAVAAYNRFVALRNRVTHSWTEIDVLLKRRHDVVPSPALTAKGVELTGAEDAIHSARRSYHSHATKYNAALRVFPGNLISGLGGFRPAKMFET